MSSTSSPESYTHKHPIGCTSPETMARLTTLRTVSMKRCNWDGVSLRYNDWTRDSEWLAYQFRPSLLRHRLGNDAREDVHQPCRVNVIHHLVFWMNPPGQASCDCHSACLCILFSKCSPGVVPSLPSAGPYVLNRRRDIGRFLQPSLKQLCQVDNQRFEVRPNWQPPKRLTLNPHPYWNALATRQANACADDPARKH